MSKERSYYEDDFIRRAQSLSPEHDKGRVYSLIFERILEKMVQQGNITDFITVPKDTIEDENGVDYFVIDTDETVIPLSITGTKRDQKRRIDKHPEVPCLFIVSEGESRTKYGGTLEKQTREMIEKYKKELQLP